MGLMGHALAASKASTLFRRFLHPFLGARTSTRAPWEPPGVPYGEPSVCLKPFFNENGEHEQILVYTVFAPYYGAQFGELWDRWAS